MSLFYPTIRVHRITEITKELLDRLGVCVLLLDVDNTLTTHNNPLPDRSVMDWLKTIGPEQGIRLVILSNNHEKRVRLFAEQLGLEYTANAMKPLKKGFRQTAQRLGVAPDRIAMVGDQVFTDTLGANLFGCKSILVDPLEPEHSFAFRFKRKLEQYLLGRYNRNCKPEEQ